jgi:hypothetical protein
MVYRIFMWAAHQERYLFKSVILNGRYAGIKIKTFRGKFSSNSRLCFVLLTNVVAFDNYYDLLLVIIF